MTLKSLETIKAASKSELISFLSRIDISVPPRTEGRTTKHCERWSICRLLATRADYHLLSYPLSLKHQDRPDFKLILGKDVIGIEFTEAIPQDYAAASALSKKEHSDGFLDMSLFKWGTKKRSVANLRSIVTQEELSGPGWDGDSVEREWTQAIAEIVNKKTHKLTSSGFEKLPINWLLIYDNLPLPMLENDKALKYLKEILQSYWNIGGRFDIVMVETGNEILEIDAISSQNREINDLWKKPNK